MVTLNREALGNTVSDEMFGANYLVPHDSDPNDPDDNSLSVANFDAGNAGLGGVQTWRYPGGSVTEQHFDIFDWNSTVSKDGIETIKPLNEFLDQVGPGGRVSIVIPTVDGLNPGSLGQRTVDQDYIDQVKVFVLAALAEAADAGVTITSFEIGNEFWGSGEMNGAEYGRLAGEMAVAVQDAIGDQADIIVQSIHALGDYTTTNDVRIEHDELTAAFMAVDGAVDATDGLVDHFYPSNFQIDEGEKSFFFDQLNRFEESTGKTFDWHLTEWNFKNGSGSDKLYGLKQATLMVETMYRMVEEGVDAAQVWPFWFSSKNGTALVHSAHGESDNLSIKHAGAAFSMMNETIRGLQTAGSGDIINNVVQVGVGSSGNPKYEHYDLEYHAFSNGVDHDVIFFSNQSEDTLTNIDVGLQNFVSGYGNSYFVTATTIGDTVSSSATSEQMAKSEVVWSYQTSEQLGLANNSISLDFNDWELTRLEITDITSGGDFIQGRGADDFIESLGGKDTLYGGDGKDSLYGGDGNDHLFGNKQNDKLFGGKGSDTLEGGNNNDKLYGQNGSDTLKGGNGSDTLEGGHGADSLNGGSGSDRLQGGKGNDILKGGSGADTFEFKMDSDNDVIIDFVDDVDIIKLKDFGFSTVDEAMSFANQSGSDVIFDFGDGDMLTVENAQAGDLWDDLVLA